MDIQEAVKSFSQSEKIKAGLIWTSSALEVLNALNEMDKAGAKKMIRLYLGMIADEVRLAARVIHGSPWNEADSHMEKALVMFDSDIPQESSFHLTRALSQVTTIGQRAMMALKEKDLI